MRMIILITLFLSSCTCQNNKSDKNGKSGDTPEQAQSSSKAKVIEDGFPIKEYLLREDIMAALAGKELFTLDLKPGDGEEFTENRQVAIDFVGWLKDGGIFDSTVRRQAPLVFLSGANRVIIGLEQGLKGMKIGGERLIIVPPRLGYGRLGIENSVPPESHLIYHVTFAGMELP